MAVVQPRGSNLSGAFQNIQRGLEQRAELEAKRPNKYTAINQTLKTIQPIFEAVMTKKIDEHFSNKNNIEITDDVIDQTSQEYGFSPEFTSRLKTYKGKHIDPKSWDSLLQSGIEDTRYEAAIQGVFPDMTPQEQSYFKSLPADEGRKAMGEYMKKKQESQQLEQRISQLPPEQQQAARADSKTFFAEKAKAQFATPKEPKSPEDKPGEYIVKIGMNEVQQQGYVSDNIKDAFNEELKKGGKTYVETVEKGIFGREKKTGKIVPMEEKPTSAIEELHKIPGGKEDHKRAKAAVAKGLITMAEANRRLVAKYGSQVRDALGK